MGDNAVDGVHDLADFGGISLCVYVVLGLAAAVPSLGLRWTCGH